MSLTKEEIKYLKICCKNGLHDWQKSASDDWEICSRFWCFTARKVVLTIVDNGGRMSLVNESIETRLVTNEPEESES